MMNLGMLAQMLMGGGNPLQAMQMFCGQNPQAQPAMQMVQGKSPDQLRQTFYNLCQSRGLKPEDVARQAGVNLPK